VTAWPLVRAIAAVTARALAVAAASASLAWGAHASWTLSRTSPRLGIGAVRVRGAVHATSDDLVLRSGLRIGQNLLAADLAAAARGVESSPWVRSVRVSRCLPPAVEITVVEHVPVFEVELGDRYLVDAGGLVFKREEPADRALRLPLVTGLTRAGWDQSRADGQQRLSLGLQFVDAWRQAGLAPEALAEVRFDAEGLATASSLARGPDGERRQEIHVGPAPFGPNLVHLEKIQSALARRNEQAGRVELYNPDRPDIVAAQILPRPDATARRVGHTQTQE
jgi:hypothetical protein